MEYTEHDLVRIAKRELNTKRPYLVADPLQGKHIPSSPSASLALFTALADTFRDAYPGERLLLIGFAETATAIGAQAAVSLGTAYIQTTREAIPDVEYLFFSEEHSHATEQKLVKNDMDAVMPHTDRIVFIEDEVTTGKTILNIISVLERVYPKGPAFSIASVLNGMPTENVLACEERGIRFHYILKTDHSDYAEKAAVFSGSGNYYGCEKKTPEPVPTLTVRGRMDARRLVDAAAYEEACEALWDAVRRTAGTATGRKILVVGTEEFMYPALLIGKKLEAAGNTVLCHSTTRSPIAASPEEGYPFHDRYELRSLYDRGRKTFLYEIDTYDKVFIVTDAPEGETEGINSLVHALRTKNDSIMLIRWC